MMRNRLAKLAVMLTALAMLRATGAYAIDQLSESPVELVRQTVNNEIGVMQPMREIAKIIRHARTNITKSAYPLFHTDAAQAALYYDLARALKTSRAFPASQKPWKLRRKKGKKKRNGLPACVITLLKN